jgi:propanediol dehydratase small subunit
MMSDSYPVSEKHAEKLKTPSGVPYGDITLEAVTQGRIAMQDLRVTAEALEMQAQIAESAGRPQLAENLRRAAELVNVPEQEILLIYNALRPGRVSPAELQRMAGGLEERYRAYRCAALLREAAAIAVGPRSIGGAKAPF